MAKVPETNQTASQLQRARQLLDQGQHQEALALALDALQGVLHNLRDSLVNLQRNLSQFQAEKGKVDPTQQELEALASLLQDSKSRVYH